MKNIALSLPAAAVVLLVMAVDDEVFKRPDPPSPAVEIVGATPGDEQLKSMLNISRDTKIDFVRWNLTLRRGENRAYPFSLAVQFGVGKQGTPDFVGGGQSRTYEGNYSIKSTGGVERYELTGSDGMSVALVKLNENLYHVLAADNKLMIGNGGWSYTLTRKDPLSVSSSLPLITGAKPDAEEMVYVGRIPCAPFADAYHLKTGENCEKLKWKLTLRTNPRTHQPTTFKMFRVIQGADSIEGSWRIVNGSGRNPLTTIYKLEANRPDYALTFLAADDILFFLSPDNKLMPANKDFSSTLNRERHTK